jgi:Tfp pilus assembly protein PilF
MSERTTQDIQGAETPAGADLQEQRDILEAGIRLALSALAQGDAETAQSELEEALRRSTSVTAPLSDIGPLP